MTADGFYRPLLGRDATEKGEEALLGSFSGKGKVFAFVCCCGYVLMMMVTDWQSLRNNMYVDYTYSEFD